MKFDKEDLWGFVNLKMNFYKDLLWQLTYGGTTIRPFREGRFAAEIGKNTNEIITGLRFEHGIISWRY